jgi:simple sugar transport system ATP-binding protein
MPEDKSPEIVVEMRGITKRFPGVLANDKVDFDLRRGEIHALLGENGAGKSTLMSVLAGLYRAEAGTIVVNGKLASFASPRDAIQAGIGMIHQHFMLVQSQTVAENILLGLEHPRFRMNLSAFNKEIAALSERFHLKVDPRAKIWQLSVGEQQRVEILKMLYRGAQVLIMDEPTAVLAPLEIEELFKTLRSMIKDGKSIIFISHKLNEVLEIADRISVLRDGRATASGLSLEGLNRADLARLMVGRNVILFVEKKPVTPGAAVLAVENVHAENDRGLPAVRGISLNVRSGEIVGLAGVAGNGQRELADLINGLRKVKQGRVLLNGQEISNQPVRKNIKGGMAYVPEDRHHVGTAPSLSITDNVIMKKYQQPPVGRGMSVDARAADQFANQLKDEYNIIVPNVKTQARLLSGGNLQRVILAREMSSNPKVMIAVQPTRGLDVGAIEGVHKYLLAEREAGAGVLLISEELEELLALSDRIYVIYEGQIMGEVTDGSLEAIGLMMTGTPLEQIRPQGQGAAAHV